MKTLIAGLALAAALVSSYSLGQDAYPVKPIQVVLPLQAASASDIAVRIVTEKMAELLGQGVVVENVSGVGGLIGANRVVTARPDGYTLAALNNSILTILPHMQRAQAKFDSFGDFVPLRGFANIPTYFGVPKDSPFSTVRRSHRACQGEARRAQLFHRRAGQPAASCDGDVPAYGRREADPRAVQGRDRRRRGPRCGPGAGHVHLALARAAVPSRRPRAAARLRRRRAQQGLPRAPDRGRERRAGL